MTAARISRSTRPLAGALVAAALIFMAAAPAVAEKGPYWETSYAANLSNKLIRGVVNIFCCPVEIPKEIIVEWQSTDPFTGVWLGFGRGIFSMGKRFTYGIYDVVTCPFPLTWDERIEPELVLLDRIE